MIATAHCDEPFAEANGTELGKVLRVSSSKLSEVI